MSKNNNRGKNFKTSAQNENARQRGNSRKPNRGGRGKEAEMNIPVKSLNTDDLHDLFFKRGDKGGNDRAWYNNVPAVIENVARVPFQLAEGSPFLPIDTAVKSIMLKKEIPEGEIPAASAKTFFPGIMRLNLVPCYGRSEDHTSSLNISALETFTVLRNAASGAIKFDQNDVMINICATDSAYMLHQWLNRAYKCAFAVDYRNQYLPNSLLAAMGINPLIREDFANFEAAINYLVVKLAKINIPDVFDILHRHAWLFGNVYKDADSAKAQMYLFNPSGLWTLMETQAEEPTRLQYSTMRTLAGKAANSEYIVDTVADVYHLINTILNPLLGSTDFGDINGRIATAYGQDKMIKIGFAEKNTPLEIVYNQEVLSEIENATIIGDGQQTFNGLYLVQKTDDLVGGPYLVSYPTIRIDPGSIGNFLYGNSPAIKRLINMHQETTDPLDIAVATRFTASVLPQDSGLGFWALNVGSEFVESVDILQFSLANAGTGKTALKSVPLPPAFVFDVLGTAPDGPIDSCDPRMLSALYYWSQFDWAPSIPIIKRVDYTQEGSTTFETHFMSFLCDVDNYAFVDTNDLRNIHEACLLSMLVNKDYPTNER